MPNTHSTASRTTSGLRGGLQVLLAALLTFAGGFNLVTPIAA